MSPAILVGALAAALGTPTGVSDDLLRLPLLLTVFGLTGTVASATNLLFNMVSTPAGIARQHIDPCTARDGTTPAGAAQA